MMVKTQNIRFKFILLFLFFLLSGSFAANAGRTTKTVFWKRNSSATSSVFIDINNFSDSELADLDQEEEDQQTSLPLFVFENNWLFLKAIQDQLQFYDRYLTRIRSLSFLRVIRI